MRRTMKKAGVRVFVILTVMVMALVIAMIGNGSNQVYAATDMGSGGASFTDATPISLGVTYSGTAVKRTDSPRYYKFTTTGNKHVSYKFWGINYTPNEWTSGISFRMYDGDGNELDDNYFNTPWGGTPKTLTLSDVKRSTTYYLSIISQENEPEGTDFAFRISQVVPKPAKVTLKSVKAGKKKLTVKFNAVPYATKYQVKYKKKGSSKWKTKTTTKTKITLKKLKKGKKYQVKVRAIRVASGKSYYGKYSKKVTKKVK